jgi:hypothetical protein
MPLSARKRKRAPKAPPEPTNPPSSEAVGTLKPVTYELRVKTYVIRYWLHEYMSLPPIHFFVSLPNSPGVGKIRVGDRLFVQAWDGGPVGAARLVVVTDIEGTAIEGTAIEGTITKFHVVHTWGWSRGATPDSVRSLALVCEPDVFPVLGAPHI